MNVTARERRLSAVLAVAALVAAAATIGLVGRAWFFFYDEWGVILYRRSGGASAFLAPHNGHLQATVIVIYRVLFAAVGLRHYGAYRAVEIGLHVVCAGLLYLYASRRCRPVVAALAAVLFAFLGAGWEVLLWPVNAGFVLPLVALLGCLLLWDAGVRWELPLTIVLGVLAVASSGLGLAVVAGLAVEAALLRKPARLVVVGAVGVSWVAWFVLYRPSALPPAGLRSLPGASPRGDVGSVGYSSANVGRLPGWILRSARATVEGLCGTARPEVAYAVGAAMALGLVWALLARRVGIRFLAVGGALGVFWVLTGLARAAAQSPEASRYEYPAALLVVLLLVEVVPRRLPAAALGVGALAVALSLLGGIHTLNRAGGGAKAAFGAEKAALARAERCRGRLPAATPLDPVRAPGLTAGPFWVATSQLGYPVPPERVGPNDSCAPGRPPAR
ncbi:MAG TPA: hypothetical protein VFA11_17025 [Acidimicrobiales bacterium]|nr:hypothetical protein [Acidimicrobiales bacterium]